MSLTLPKIIYCVWSGKNTMSAQRAASLLSIVQNTGCPVCLVTDDNRFDFEVSEHPFHDAYEYLSETHKADYLRAYLMHHHGGGYTDIKPTKKSWRPFFSALMASDWDFVGYPEVGAHGVAPVGGELEEELRSNWQALVGMGAYIFRPRTRITSAWIGRMHNVLDNKLENLRVNPSSWPQDAFGRLSPSGQKSDYPISWTEILGNILHPICLENRDRIGRVDLAPQFFDYR